MTLVSKIPSQQYGFTLIELMVVMVIMMFSIGLVGGLVVDSADKAKAYSEQLEFKSMLDQLAQKAFLDAQEYEIQLNTDTLKVLANNKQVFTYQFDYLAFPTQTISLSAHGFYNSKSIRFKRRELTQTIDLPNLLAESPSESLGHLEENVVIY